MTNSGFVCNMAEWGLRKEEERLCPRRLTFLHSHDGKGVATCQSTQELTPIHSCHSQPFQASQSRPSPSFSPSPSTRRSLRRSSSSGAQQTSGRGSHGSERVSGVLAVARIPCWSVPLSPSLLLSPQSNSLPLTALRKREGCADARPVHRLDKVSFPFRPHLLPPLTAVLPTSPSPFDSPSLPLPPHLPPAPSTSHLHRHPLCPFYQSVSGCLLFAKSSLSASRLSQQLQRHDVQRTYLAVVHGKLKQGYTGEIDARLRMDDDRVRVCEEGEGVEAKTVWECLAASVRLFLLPPYPESLLTVLGDAEQLLAAPAHPEDGAKTPTSRPLRRRPARYALSPSLHYTVLTLLLQHPSSATSSSRLQHLTPPLSRSCQSLSTTSSSTPRASLSTYAPPLSLSLHTADAPSTHAGLAKERQARNNQRRFLPSALLPTLLPRSQTRPSSS